MRADRRSFGWAELSFSHPRGLRASLPWIPDALSPASPDSRLSADSASVDLLFFNLSGTRVSWAALAASRLHIPSPDHPRIRLDGKHRAAHGRHQFADFGRGRRNRPWWLGRWRVSSSAKVASFSVGTCPKSSCVGVANSLKRMVGSTELESVTSCVSSRRSNQLSYEPGRSGVAMMTCNGQDNMAISVAAISTFIWHFDLKLQIAPNPCCS